MGSKVRGFYGKLDVLWLSKWANNSNKKFQDYCTLFSLRGYSMVMRIGTLKSVASMKIQSENLIVLFQAIG